MIIVSALLFSLFSLFSLLSFILSSLLCLVEELHNTYCLPSTIGPLIRVPTHLSVLLCSFSCDSLYSFLSVLKDFLGGRQRCGASDSSEEKNQCPICDQPITGNLSTFNVHLDTCLLLQEEEHLSPPSPSCPVSKRLSHVKDKDNPSDERPLSAQTSPTKCTSAPKEFCPPGVSSEVYSTDGSFKSSCQ